MFLSKKFSLLSKLLSDSYNTDVQALSAICNFLQKFISWLGTQVTPMVGNNLLNPTKQDLSLWLLFLLVFLVLGACFTLDIIVSLSFFV